MVNVMFKRMKLYQFLLLVEAISFSAVVVLKLELRMAELGA